MTPAQQRRQKHRDSGKYAKVNPCYRCGKSAGDNYWSDRRTDSLLNDEAICLCTPCRDLLDKMTDEQIVAEVKSADYGHKKQGK